MTTLEKVRQNAQEILDRAKQDEDFLHQLKNDPRETLRTAGFPDEGAIDFGLEISANDEVHGYMLCDRITCIISWCGYVPLTRVQN